MPGILDSVFPDAFSTDRFGDYSNYQMWHNYHTDRGLITLPVAGNTPAHVTVRIHGGLGTRVVNWVAARSGKPPVIPSVTGNGIVEGSDEIRNYSVEFTQVPNPARNGYNWVVKGSYIYVQDEIREPGTDVFPTNAYPFLTEPMFSQSAALLNAAGGTITSAINAQDDSLDYTTNSFLWPHTFFPATSINENLIQRTPT